MTENNWIRAGVALVNLAATRRIEYRPVEPQDGRAEFEVVADGTVIWSGSHEGAERVFGQLSAQLAALDLDQLVDTAK